ncbi:MAG: GC-type dockerin domain-anchored protein [Planctomycetota bacterium]
MRGCFRASLIVAFVPAPLALGQAADPTVLVANNGNLLGAVTSFQPGPDGGLVEVDYLVIDERPAGDPAERGTNVEGIALSPGGRFLATGHATALDPEQLTIIEVRRDGTLQQLDEFLVPNAPLGIAWVADDLVAVAESALGDSTARVYRYTPGAEPGQGSLVQTDATETGTFITNLESDPRRRLLFVQDSDFGGGAANVASYEVDDDGELLLVDRVFTSPNFALDMALAPNGDWLYAGGGISGTGSDVLGFSVASGGGLGFIGGSPFASPGDSPAWVTVTGDSRYVFAGHGRDATVQGFATDAVTGALSATGASFDVGSQGTLGTVGTLTLPAGEFLYVTDNSTVFDGLSGIYAFRVENDGALVQVGDIVPTQGSQPDNFVVWEPATIDCPPDLDGDGELTVFDFLAFQNLFALGDPAADFDGDGELTLFDFLAFQNAFGVGCG